MTPRPIIIDTDPGQDDAVAMLLALASPEELELLGVTAVAGNVPLELTEKNARRIVELAGRPDIPVYAGCARPMVRAALSPRSTSTARPGSTVPTCPSRRWRCSRACGRFLVDTLLAAPRCLDHAVHARAADQRRDGSGQGAGHRAEDPRDRADGRRRAEGGNITPAAEFNIYVDPHAADNVLQLRRADHDDAARRHAQGDEHAGAGGAVRGTRYSRWAGR